MGMDVVACRPTVACRFVLFVRLSQNCCQRKWANSSRVRIDQKPVLEASVRHQWSNLCYVTVKLGQNCRVEPCILEALRSSADSGSYTETGFLFPIYVVWLLNRSQRQIAMWSAMHSSVSGILQLRVVRGMFNFVMGNPCGFNVFRIWLGK